MIRPNSSKLPWSLLALTLMVVASTSAQAYEGSPAAWPTETCPIQAGELLPSAMVTAADGSAVDLAESVSEKPTLLVFFRGGW